MIFSVKCDKCSLILISVDTFSRDYIVKPPGLLKKIFGLGASRVAIPQPCVNGALDKILPKEHKGKSYVQYDAAYMSAEWEKKVKENYFICPRCSSPDMKTVASMVDHPCPVCKDGTIRKKIMGIT